MAVIMIMAISAILVLGLSAGRDTVVEANKSSPDSFGYMWVDNVDPEPKIEYEWIDTTKDGVYLSNVKSYSSNADSNQIYKLPFHFPFYGQYYDEVMVHASGYVDFAPYYPYSYYGQTFPSTSYQNGWIAVLHGYNGAYPGIPMNFRAYALEGRTFGERWVCFEWNKCYAYYYGSYYAQNYGYDAASFEQTFEVILYESGLIKMQYKDATAGGTPYTTYTNGYYSCVGIENEAGTVGRQYSTYSQQNINDGLAIMWGINVMNVKEATLDTDEGGVLYAQYRDYTVDALVTHPVSYTEVRAVSATLGQGLADMMMYYSSDGTYIFSEIDPDGYVTLDTAASRVYVEGTDLRVTFKFSPTASYPTSSFQTLSVTAMGAGAIISTYRLKDAYWVENKLDLSGSLYAYSFDRGYIGNGGWVHGNEDFQFRGVRAVYPNTDLSPRPGSVGFTMIDEKGVSWVQEYVEGSCMVDVTAENDYIRKLYNLTLSNVPPGTDVSGGLSYVINIDPFSPLPPQGIKVHADSFEDRMVDFDDDNEVYVTWEPAEDYESGILGYYVSDFDPLAEEGTRGAAKWVESPDTSTKLTFDVKGIKKIWVWSVDRAGNPSAPNLAITNIDGDEVIFSEFSPGHQVWVNTHTPVTSILISDGKGSGVSAKDVQYAISTTTKDEYTSWVTAKVSRDDQEVRISVKNTFGNGKSNWIKFRAMDLAGNGWTYSPDYNLWIDEESPNFINFRPHETEVQNGRYVVVSLDISDQQGFREGSGIRTETTEYRYSTGGKELFGDWMPADITTFTDQSIHVEMEIQFEEGKNNYVQFRTYDNVGNFAQSREFNVIVNSAPDIKATLGEPSNGITYLTTERVYFDASQSEDPDGDDLDFAWYSDIDGFLSSSGSFFKALSPGNHMITLIASDPAHSVVLNFDITVMEPEQVDPASIDSDGDGMYDAWEIRYGLNPFRPDGAIDSDNDMFTNFQEFQNNTDPTRRTSHPAYPVGVEPDTEGDDAEEQYRVVTIAVILISLVVVLVLILLALSKRRNFLLEVDEEKELEAEELDYRHTLERKKSGKSDTK
ncbi:MAG: fibronectin type III domain-containing protein [Candidatus Thermoplasmatota archaeon]|nr:fibronectin type III domain-containing protein [Candidatus Thermoplasmatota archaeon]